MTQVVNANVTQKKEVGSWIECLNPFDNPVQHFFFRHIPGDKRFDRNDVAKICPVCWDEAQRRNGTLIQAPKAHQENAWREHLSKNKPGADTL